MGREVSPNTFEEIKRAMGLRPRSAELPVGVIVARDCSKSRTSAQPISGRFLPGFVLSALGPSLGRNLSELDVGLREPLFHLHFSVRDSSHFHT